MSFSQALSGLNAQSQKLGAIGNNIANSQTVGFKSSNVQFADVFANSRVGLGTRVSAVLQNFNEGNIESTNRNLDLAVAGEGFFRFQLPSGEVAYSRNGQLTMTAGGELINAQGAQIMGYQANQEGGVQVGGQPVPLGVSAEDLPASSTTRVAKEMNLDSRVVAGSGLNETEVVTNMANPNSMVSRESLDYHYSNSFTVFDSLGNPRNVQIFYEKRAEGDNAWLGKVVMDGYYDMTMDPVGRATGAVSEAVDEAQGVAESSVGALQSAMLSLSASLEGLQNAMHGAATAAQDEGEDADGIRQAAEDAAQRFISSGGSTLSEVLAKYLSGEEFGEAQQNVLSTYFEQVQEAMADAGVNGAGVVAAIADFGEMDEVKDATDGFVDSLSSAIVGGVPQQFVGVAEAALGGIGESIEDAVSFNAALEASNNFDVEGDDETFDAVVASVGNVAAAITAGESQEVSEGVQEVLDAIGDVDTESGVSALAAAAAEADPGEKFEAFGTNDFVIEFNANGTLKRVGQPATTADGGVEYRDVQNNRPVINFASNGETPLGGATQDLSFEINLAGTTQFGNSSSVNTLTQDGYTSGSLVGITIEDDGTIMRNYSNEQSLAAGQIALANFRNPEGLTPAGDNVWYASAQSGQELVGAPGTGMLGAIVAGAVETSNVDMAGELVNMIIAQRAYQANSQTIKTQDEILQTAINLR